MSRRKWNAVVPATSDNSQELDQQQNGSALLWFCLVLGQEEVTSNEVTTDYICILGEGGEFRSCGDV